jgi:pilus assembly protein CpaB
MNRRLILVFLFAVLVAGSASFLLYRVLSSQLSAAAKPRPAGKLLVASHDLEVGTLIKEADLQQVAWNGPVPEEVLNDAHDVAGRGVVANIYNGEPIREKRLAPKGAGAGLAAIIPIGKRAVAMKVDEVVGLAGFVVPGMRVDVVVSSAGAHSAQEDTSARTVLQNIEVLSAGQHIERNVEGKPENVQVVNLLVTPEQAEILSLVSNETKVQLVLRNPLDTKEEETHGASLAKLFGVSAPVRTPLPIAPVIRNIPEPRVKELPKPPAIEVFQGAKRSEQPVDGGIN